MHELSVIKKLEGEILGAESQFAIQRSAKKQEWEPIILAAKDFKVANAESKEMAVGYGRLLMASEKELKILYVNIKQSIDQIKKPILEAERIDMDAIKKAKDHLGSLVQAFNAEQDKIQREELRKAQEAARKAAEEAKIAEAILLEAAGEKEEAEIVLNEKPMLQSPVIIQNAPAKARGEVVRTTWKAVVTNFESLVRAVAAGQVPIMALSPNESWLNTQAVQFEKGLNYPGIEPQSETKTHFRSF